MRNCKEAYIDGIADALGRLRPAMLRGPRRFSLPIEKLALIGAAAAKDAALEIGRCASGRKRRRLGRLAEVAKEPGDAFRILRSAITFGAPTAVLAGLEVGVHRVA